MFGELPEPEGNERTLPDETYVIVGYTRGENSSWITQNMKYPARIGANTRGSIILDKNVVSAKYLLSYNADGQKLFKISNEQGLKVVTKDELKAQGYGNPHHPNYLLFQLVEAEKEFDGMRFDIKALNEEAYKSKEVFAVSLVELIKNKRF